MQQLKQQQQVKVEKALQLLQLKLETLQTEVHKLLKR
jgi:hypothetical protein